MMLYQAGREQRGQRPTASQVGKILLTLDSTVNKYNVVTYLIAKRLLITICIGSCGRDKLSVCAGCSPVALTL
jgi:hypothetical protein